MRLIVATHNKHKLQEIKEALSDYDYQVIGLDEVDFDFEIEENKDTFIDNALVKARTIKSFYPNDAILADDSGFCVSALNNDPGVHSARFLGHETPDYIKNQQILKMIENNTNRNTMFVCAMVLLINHDEFVTQQFVYGTIPYESSGMGGFGYDPIFVPNGHELTFAQDPQTKSQISHRAKAIREVIEYVKYLNG